MPRPLTLRPLEPDEVHVWRVDLSAQIDTSALTPDEQQRAQRFRRAADQRRFRGTRAVLRTILGQYLEVRPDSLRFQYTESGKPFLDPPAIRFNVSHSGDRALLAFTLQHDVGIDIEDLTMERNIALLAKLVSLPETVQKETFLKAWTRREAAGKALGVGLSVSPSDFSDSSAWTLCNLDAGAGYAAAVAVRSPGIALRLWDWTTASGTVSSPV